MLYLSLFEVIIPFCFYYLSWYSGIYLLVKISQYLNASSRVTEWFPTNGKNMEVALQKIWVLDIESKMKRLFMSLHAASLQL